MAMKGQNGHSRKRLNVYLITVIVMLVFGAAILGVMGIHRLKDRRIFDLLIKEKDHKILSLQLLFQKEKEQLQEVKMKNEEMKMKLYNLRAQKTELNGKMLEMQSTISSLKEEQRTIQLAFDEKQSEANLLKQRSIQLDDRNLTEILTQKETEIQDLKHRLQLTVKDHANITEKETTIDQSQYKNGDNQNQTSKEEFERLENSKENGTVEPKKDYETWNREIFETKQENEEAHFTDANANPTMDDGQSRTISKYQGNVSQQPGGVKLEMQENSHHGSYRLRGKQGYLRRAKGKRWRVIAKQTEEISDKHESINQDKIQDSVTGLRIQNQSVQQSKKDDNFQISEQNGNGKTNLDGNVGFEDSPPGKLGPIEVAKVEKEFEVGLTNSSSVESHTSLDEVPKYTTISSEPVF